MQLRKILIPAAAVALLFGAKTVLAEDGEVIYHPGGIDSSEVVNGGKIDTDYYYNTNMLQVNVDFLWLDTGVAGTEWNSKPIRGRMGVSVNYMPGTNKEQESLKKKRVLGQMVIMDLGTEKNPIKDGERKVFAKEVSTDLLRDGGVGYWEFNIDTKDYKPNEKHKYHVYFIRTIHDNDVDLQTKYTDFITWGYTASEEVIDTPDKEYKGVTRTEYVNGKLGADGYTYEPVTKNNYTERWEKLEISSQTPVIMKTGYGFPLTDQTLKYYNELNISELPKGQWQYDFAGLVDTFRIGAYFDKNVVDDNLKKAKKDGVYEVTPDTVNDEDDYKELIGKIKIPLAKDVTYDTNNYTVLTLTFPTAFVKHGNEDTIYLSKQKDDVVANGEAEDNDFIDAGSKFYIPTWYNIIKNKKKFDYNIGADAPVGINQFRLMPSAGNVNVNAFMINSFSSPTKSLDQLTPTPVFIEKYKSKDKDVDAFLKTLQKADDSEQEPDWVKNQELPHNKSEESKAE
jgi:hypothetical protein